MIDWKSVSSQVLLLDQEQSLAFANAVAARYRDVIRYFATESTTVVADVIYTTLASVKASVVPNVEKSISDLLACPELDEDDSHKPTYYAMRGLGILMATLRCTDELHATARWAEEAAGLAANLASDLDWFQEQFTKKTGQSMAKTIEAAEFEAQMSVIGITRNDNTESRYAQIEVVNNGASKLIRSGIRSVCDYYKWPCAGLV